MRRMCIFGRMASLPYFCIIIQIYDYMRIVIQRVLQASVSIAGALHSSIGPGMMVLVGVETGDTEDDVRRLAAKTVALRIFNDEAGVMNRSVADVGGDVLAGSRCLLQLPKAIGPAMSVRQGMTLLYLCTSFTAAL